MKYCPISLPLSCYTNILVRLHGVGKFFLLQRLGSELIERQANPAFKSRLANALQSLTSSNQLSSTLDRMNYQRFRKNLTNFLIEVRGFLRTMWCVQSIVYMFDRSHLFSYSSSFARNRNLSISSFAWPSLSGNCTYYKNRNCNSVIKLESFLVLDVSYDETAIIQVRCQSSIGGPCLHGSNSELQITICWLLVLHLFTSSGVSFRSLGGFM